MKYRMRCIGKRTYSTVEGRTVLTEDRPRCGWTGVRTDHVDCECYDIWRLYCRPLTPGPGCPSGIVWPCPRCGGAVNGAPVKHREAS